MSGRTRHFRDGELITNRKTDRRNPRTREQDKPELRFIFMLPHALSFSTSPGVYHNASIDVDGTVTVRSKDRAWVLDAAKKFLGRIAGKLDIEPIAAVLFCPSYPAPTMGAPARPGWKENFTIAITAGVVSITRAGRCDPT